MFGPAVERRVCASVLDVACGAALRGTPDARLHAILHIAGSKHEGRMERGSSAFVCQVRKTRPAKRQKTAQVAQDCEMQGGSSSLASSAGAPASSASSRACSSLCVGGVQTTLTSAVHQFIVQNRLEGRLPLLAFSMLNSQNLHKPCSLAFDQEGSLLIADCLNNRVVVANLVLGSGGHKTALAVQCNVEKSRGLHYPQPTSVVTHNAVGTYVITRNGLVSCVADRTNQQGVPNSDEVEESQHSSPGSQQHLSAAVRLIAFDAVRDSVAIIQEQVKEGAIRVQKVSAALTSLGRPLDVPSSRQYTLQITSREGVVRTTKLGYIPGGLAFDETSGNVLVSKRQDECVTVGTTCYATTSRGNDVRNKCFFNLKNQYPSPVSVHRVSFKGPVQPAASMLVCTVRLYMSVCLSLCPSVCLSVCLSVFLSIVSIYLTIYLSHELSCLLDASSRVCLSQYIRRCCLCRATPVRGRGSNAV